MGYSHFGGGVGKVNYKHSLNLFKCVRVPILVFRKMNLKEIRRENKQKTNKIKTLIADMILETIQMLIYLNKKNFVFYLQIKIEIGLIIFPKVFIF